MCVAWSMMLLLRVDPIDRSSCPNQPQTLQNIWAWRSLRAAHRDQITIFVGLYMTYFCVDFIMFQQHVGAVQNVRFVATTLYAALSNGSRRLIHLRSTDLCYDFTEICANRPVIEETVSYSNRTIAFWADIAAKLFDELIIHLRLSTFTTNNSNNEPMR